MIHTLSRSLVALALVPLASGFSSTAVTAADERPDLKIELLGLPLAGSQREVQVKITNVSKWWSDETKLRVETTPAAAGNVLNRDVENLDPGQSVTFRYTLAAACGMQSPNTNVLFGDYFADNASDIKIRAAVSAGKNYEGVMESGDLLKNNSAEASACVATTPPSNTGIKPVEPATGKKNTDDAPAATLLLPYFEVDIGNLSESQSDSNP